MMHELVIIIAKYFLLISLVVSLVIWLKLVRNDKRKFILQAILGAILTLALAKLGSKLFYDPRPFVVGHFTPYFSHSADNGFPSDHTLLTSFLAILVFNYNRQAGIGLFVVALAVGLSRVVAGVHHLADIIGSIVFAIIGYYVAVWLIGLILNRINKPIARVSD